MEKDLSFEEAQELISKKTEELIKLKHQYSNSNIKREIPTERSTIYIKQISDLHASKLDKLVDETVEFLTIPGAYIVLNGDLINGDIPSKKNTNIFGKLKSPQEELDSVVIALKKALKGSGVDPKKVLVSWTDGNHDLRITDMTSFQPGHIATGTFGIQEVYSENLAELIFKIPDPLTKNEFLNCTITASHGNQMPNNAGAALDTALVKNVVKGVNLVLYAHTHVPACGTMTSKINDKGVEKVIETMAFNPGSEQSRENYVDKNGYGLCGRPDGEIIRISAIPDETTKKSKLCVDMINQRQVYDKENRVWSSINKIIDNFESKEYDNKKDLTKEYKDTLEKTVSIIKKDASLKPRVHNREMALSILSGFMIGKPDLDNDEKIAKVINAIKKVPNCNVILNGDMVYYHEASTFRQKKKERFPEDSYAYIELLAQRLEPIKDKIITYNSGAEEAKIMKYHGAELARYAMNTLQMDEKLVYKPYNKIQYQAEQLKIQTNRVKAYNKSVLSDECVAFAKNPKKLAAFREYYDENYGKKKIVPNKSDIYKDFVAKELRKEGKLLSLEDKQLINEKFPLFEIDLRVPHENLIQNILFTKLGLDLKKVEVNTNYNTQTRNKIKMYTQSGTSSPIYVTGQYSTSNAGRTAQENNLLRTENTNTGYDIYYTTPKKNCEYMTKGTVAYVIDGKTTLKTIYHLCAPRFDTKQYVENIDSNNRLYLFKKVPKNQYMLEEERKGRSVFVDESQDNYTIVGSSISYDSILLQDNVKIDILKKMLVNSYNKKNQELLEKQAKVQEVPETMFEKTLQKTNREKVNTKNNNSDDHRENCL